MGRAKHGRAVARGRVASGRAESCKYTALRVGRIAPLARERSHVILVGHIRVTRTKSPHRTRAVHDVTGIPLLYGSPPRRGESEPSPGGRFPTLHSSCGQEHSLHCTRYIGFAHRQSDVGCLDFVLAPLHYALPGGEPCTWYTVLYGLPPTT